MDAGGTVFGGKHRFQIRIAPCTVSIPTLVYSGMAVYPSGARYCVVDLAGVASSLGIEADRQQTLTALYYLLYRSHIIVNCDHSIAPSSGPFRKA